MLTESGLFGGSCWTATTVVSNGWIVDWSPNVTSAAAVPSSKKVDEAGGGVSLSGLVGLDGTLGPAFPDTEGFEAPAVEGAFVPVLLPVEEVEDDLEPTGFEVPGAVPGGFWFFDRVTRGVFVLGSLGPGFFLAGGGSLNSASALSFEVLSALSLIYIYHFFVFNF